MSGPGSRRGCLPVEVEAVYPRSEGGGTPRQLRWESRPTASRVRNPARSGKRRRNREVGRRNEGEQEALAAAMVGTEGAMASG
jgi:hypothetical protein